MVIISGCSIYLRVYTYVWMYGWIDGCILTSMWSRVAEAQCWLDWSFWSVSVSETPVSLFNVTCFVVWINHRSIHFLVLISGNGRVSCFHHFSIQPAADHENGVVTTTAGGVVSWTLTYIDLILTFIYDAECGALYYVPKTWCLFRTHKRQEL